MELCVAIEGQENVRWHDWTALATACETHGVPCLYSSDHYLSLRGGEQSAALDTWGAVCALAAVTSSVRLGTFVSPASFRHPSVLAKLAVTADHVSGGRVDLGMGAGWYEPEHRAFGLPFPDVSTRMAVLEEQVEIVSGLLGPGPFSYAGTHYGYGEVDAWPKPVHGRIPLIIGGAAGPRGVRLAARWADEYNSVGASPGECRRRRERLDSACEAAGRDPATLRFSVRMWLLTGRDERELLDRAVAVAEMRGERNRTPPELVRELDAAESWVVGPVEAAAEQLRALADAGADRLVLAVAAHDDLDQIELIARELAPLVS